jgi:hypothetical protein
MRYFQAKARIGVIWVQAEGIGKGIVCDLFPRARRRVPNPGLPRQHLQQFFQQLAETPFGHILQSRLYLFKVGKAAIAKHQALWHLDGQTVEYRGVELQMSHISDLIISEYQQAHTLLHDELMFQARDLIPMESWRLKDDLDLEDFGCSWLSHPGNSEFVEGAELALFRRIQENAELRAMFLTVATDGNVILCPKAMAIYEAHAQDFLKRVFVGSATPGTLHVTRTDTGWNMV